MIKYPEIIPIIKLIHDMADSAIIQKELEKLVENNYREGFRAGARDQSSRDYASRHNHDMGQ